METSQGLVDAYVAGLDIALREMGTGDLSMAKKMKKLGQAYFGRLKALGETLEALPDTQPLSDLMARTVLADGSGAPEPFVRYVMEADRRLADTPIERLLGGEADWPEVRA